MRPLYLFLLVPLLTLPLAAEVSAKEACGLDGTIPSRITDCQKTKKGWGKPPLHLVSRTEEGEEIWLEQHQDTKGKVRSFLWGDRLDEQMTLEEAKDACSSRRFEHGTLAYLDWRLPKYGDFHRLRSKSLGGNDLYKRLEYGLSIRFGKGQWLWTSSAYQYYGLEGTADYYHRFNTVYGGFRQAHQSKESSVRCLAPLPDDLNDSSLLPPPVASTTL